MNEMVFIPLKNYEGLYSINGYGIIRSEEKLKGKKNILVPQKIYNTNVSRNGYSRIKLCKNGDAKIDSCHRVTAKQFIPNPSNLPSVNHKDGNKQNNSIDNLEWCTYSENSKHSFDNGLQKKKFGKDNHTARKIVQKNLNGEVLKEWDTIIEAARFYNLPACSVRQVCTGRLKQSGGFIWNYI